MSKIQSKTEARYSKTCIKSNRLNKYRAQKKNVVV